MFQAHLPPPFPRASSYCTALVKCKVSGQSEKMILVLTAIVLGEQLGNVETL